MKIMLLNYNQMVVNNNLHNHSTLKKKMKRIRLMKSEKKMSILNLWHNLKPAKKTSTFQTKTWYFNTKSFDSKKIYLFTDRIHKKYFESFLKLTLYNQLKKFFFLLIFTPHSSSIFIIEFTWFPSSKIHFTYQLVI